MPFLYSPVYPEGCIKYYGPHPIECLETIWNTTECLPEGSEYPSKREFSEILRTDSLNLRLVVMLGSSFLSIHVIWLCIIRQIINETNITRELSDNGDVEKQLECFGLGKNDNQWFCNLLHLLLICSSLFFLVYPENCTKYYGPHPVDCLITMWRTATCLQEGYKYPQKLSSTRLNELDAWNIRLAITCICKYSYFANRISFLREISGFFNATATSADDGSLINQTYCFGMGKRLYNNEPFFKDIKAIASK